MPAHQNAEDRNRELMRELGRHLPTPTTMEQRDFATQLNQARAITHGVEQVSPRVERVRERRSQGSSGVSRLICAGFSGLPLLAQ